MSDKFHFIWVGATRKKELLALEEDYLFRVGKFFPSSRKVVPPEKNRSRSENEIRSRESEALMEASPRGALLVVLDERGSEMTSREFSKWIGKSLESSPNGVAFVTGGDLGLSEEIRKVSSTVLALSKMTLPHEVARVVLLEQVYRACTLLRGIHYHK